MSGLGKLTLSILTLAVACSTPSSKAFGPGDQKSDSASSANKRPPQGQYVQSHAPMAGFPIALELKPLVNFTRYTGEYKAVMMGDDGVTETTVEGAYRVYRRRVRFSEPSDHLRTVPLMALFNQNEERIARWIVTDMTSSGFIALSEVHGSKQSFMDFVAGANGAQARNIECELNELVDDNVFEEGLGVDNDATGVSVFQNPSTPTSGCSFRSRRSRTSAR